MSDLTRKLAELGLDTELAKILAEAIAAAGPTNGPVTDQTVAKKLAALEKRVTAAEGRIETNSADLTNKSSDVSDIESRLDAAEEALNKLPSGTPAKPTWADITGKPTKFPADPTKWAEIPDKPTTFPPAVPTTTKRGGVLQQAKTVQAPDDVGTVGPVDLSKPIEGQPSPQHFNAIQIVLRKAGLVAEK